MSEELLRWPDWMPVAIKEDYSYAPTDRTVSTDMDIGGVRRVEFDTDETRITCSLMLDSCETAFFETFERDCLRQGTRWFVMPIKYGGEVRDSTVQLVARPKFGNMVGGFVTASVELTLGKRDLLDGDMMGAFLHVSPGSAVTASAVVHNALHSVFPGVTVLPPEVTQ